MAEREKELDWKKLREKNYIRKGRKRKKTSINDVRRE